MLMEEPAASLAQLFPCHVVALADQPQEAVFSGDHAEHAEDGEWQRSTSTTSSQSERAEQLLQNQHKSLASEDTKKKRAQKPSHMRRNIRYAAAGQKELGSHMVVKTESLHFASELCCATAGKPDGFSFPKP